MQAVFPYVFLFSMVPFTTGSNQRITCGRYVCSNYWCNMLTSSPLKGLVFQHNLSHISLFGGATTNSEISVMGTIAGVLPGNSARPKPLQAPRRSLKVFSNPQAYHRFQSGRGKLIVRRDWGYYKFLPRLALTVILLIYSVS